MENCGATRYKPVEVKQERVVYWLGVYFDGPIGREGPFPDKESVWKRFRELARENPDLVLKIEPEADVGGGE